MKDVQVNDYSVIEEVTEEELELATGAGDGWFSTITDDCPNSIIVCC